MKASLGRAVRIGFLLLAVALLALALRENGDEAYDAARDVGAAAALGSLGAVLVGLLASAMVWRALLADLGTALPMRPALHVFFLGQLGKYVPGSVFAIAAQMELGRAHGAPRSRVGTASLLFMGVLVVAGLVTAAVALPLTSPEALRDFAWVLAVLPVGLLVLHPRVLTRIVGVRLAPVVAYPDRDGVQFAPNIAEAGDPQDRVFGPGLGLARSVAQVDASAFEDEGGDGRAIHGPALSLP